MKKPTRIASTVASLFVFFLRITHAQEIPTGGPAPRPRAQKIPEGDPVSALQTQVGELERLVKQQQKEIGALRKSILQLQMRERGSGYPTSIVDAQRVEGRSISGIPLALNDGGSAPGTPQQQDTPPNLGTSRKSSATEARQSATEVAAQGHAPLFYPKLTLTVGWNDTYYDRRELALSGFLALDAIFLGNISVAQTKAHIETFDVAMQYGLTHDLTLDLDLPYVLRNSTFLSAGQNASTAAVSQASVSNGDVGDVTFGADYRLIREHNDIPDIVASLKIVAPTGTSPFGIGVTQPDPQNTNLQVPQRLPTGNGVWSINPSLSVLKSNDPIVLFGSIGYVYNVARYVSVINPVSIDSPGIVRLGDGIQIGGGFAVVLNDRASISTSLSSLLSRSTDVKLPGQAYQTINGSSSTNVSLGFGLNYALTPHLTLSTIFQAGLTPDTPNYALSVRFPYLF